MDRGGMLLYAAGHEHVLSMAGAVAAGGAVGALLRWQTNALTLSIFGPAFRGAR